MPSSKITVFYLDHSQDFSGGQKSLLALLTLIDKARINPVVILDKNAKKMMSELDLIQVPYIRINFLNQRIVEYLLVIVPIVRIFMKIRQGKCDLLHCNTFKSGFIGSVISFLLPVPVIFRARLGITVNSHGIIDKIIFDRADCILANSHYVKHTFENRFGVSEKIKVIYNPLIKNIRLNAQKVQEFKARYFSNETFFYFGLISRIEPFKKLHVIIEAARILAGQRKDFKILFIGANSKIDGDEYAIYLQSLIQKYGLADRFEFTGFVSEIFEISSLLDSVVLCTEGEPLSRGVFESQFLGIPVIASNSGGNVELIIDEETGLLFDLGDSASLAQKMELIMSNQELKNRVASQGQRLVDELFNDNNTVVQEMNVYSTLVGR